MELQGSHFVGLLLVLVTALARTELATATATQHVTTSFNRTSFPPGFLFGVASSAYQFEGAAKEDGKGPSIWDTFTHKFPGKITNGSNGDVALDFYHRYKEDVKLLKFIGMDALRFSISWSRVLPHGKLSGGVNKAGIDFYNNLINELLSKGITPFATIFHWDLPQALEDEYGGFLSPRILEDFRDFADLCFKEFGDRVKNWITMNEPWSYSYGGYDAGLLAPGRCSAWMKFCPTGNSGTEPYIVTHHLLLAHATTVKLYKQKYQASQKGQIGITLVTYWFNPYSNSAADKEATQRLLDFNYGWYIEPLTFGDYPQVMRKIVGNRLPKFTPEQSALLKGSFDFIGLNYYITNYVKNIPYTANRVNISYTNDAFASQTTERNGVSIGKPTGVPTFFVYPKGLTEYLIYTKEKYNNPTIYITENGMGDNNNVSTEVGIKDPQRIYFYHQHLLALKAAIDAGVKVKGFFGWSFMDNFEWLSGYTQRFGVVYVDFNDGLKRYPKQTALWFKKFLLKS